jgi:hypothetical protein
LKCPFCPLIHDRITLKQHWVGRIDPVSGVKNIAYFAAKPTTDCKVLFIANLSTGAGFNVSGCRVGRSFSQPLHAILCRFIRKVHCRAAPCGLITDRNGQKLRMSRNLLDNQTTKCSASVFVDHVVSFAVFKDLAATNRLHANRASSRFSNARSRVFACRAGTELADRRIRSPDLARRWCEYLQPPWPSFSIVFAVAT